MINQPLGSVTRVKLLRALADNGSCVWLPDLAEAEGISLSAARDAMRRPRVAGWVATIKQQGPTGGPRLYYRITVSGRAYLASLDQEES